MCVEHFAPKYGYIEIVRLANRTIENYAKPASLFLLNLSWSMDDKPIFFFFVIFVGEMKCAWCSAIDFRLNLRKKDG